MLTQVFSIFVPFYYIFVLWWDYTYIDFASLVVPMRKQDEFYKGRLKFLTMWNMCTKSNFVCTMSFMVALHFIQAAHFWYACYYDWNYVNVPVEVYSIGLTLSTGKLKFLTFWNALLQATFFTICLLNNYVGTNEINPKSKPLIRKIRDLVLASLAFPLSLYVGVTFWSIYAVDRELIFPKALDAFFPSWLNHAMHTNIMIFIFIQIYSSYHEYPSRKAGIAILSSFMFTYLVWINILHAYTGIWVYPVLEVLNFPVRLIFFAISLGIGILLYIIGEKLNSFLWSGTVEKNKRKKHN